MTDLLLKIFIQSPQADLTRGTPYDDQGDNQPWINFSTYQRQERRLLQYLGGNIMRKTLRIALIILLGLSELALGQTGKDAFKSLKKVEAKIESGVSHQDYPQVLADAKQEVDMFLESSEAKKNSQFVYHIKMAMDYYKTAEDIWEVKFNCKDNFVMEIININSNCGRQIKRLYNNSKAEILPGNLGPVYVVSNVLRNIFNDASKQLKQASELLKSD